MESHVFSYTTKYGQFTDAITLPEGHGLTAEEIEAMKIDRLNKWLAHLDEVHAQQAQEPQ
jgi:hypothetical protein